jgi:hypothetical protein
LAAKGTPSQRKEDKVLASLPHYVTKKYRLLKRFKKELSISIKDSALPSYFCHFEDIVGLKEADAGFKPVFVENIRIKKAAVLFWLSNGCV